MASLPKFAKAALTKELQKLAGQVITIDKDGTAFTREELLARMIWDYALGWTEQRRDDNGTLKEVYHPPVAWAMQFLFERVEGKAAPMSDPQTDNTVRAADKVRELAKARINSLA